MMDQCGLLDLWATGSLLTWYRKNDGLIKMSKRLDRGISDCDWRNMFSKAYVENLSKLQSDHRPILLRCSGFIPPKNERPFRFHAAWLTQRFSRGCPRCLGEGWALSFTGFEASEGRGTRMY